LSRAFIKDGANVVPFDGFAEPQAAIAKRALRSGFTSICANAPTFESLRSPEPDLDLSTAPVINLNADDVVSPETQPIRTTCCIFQFSCRSELPFSLLRRPIPFHDRLFWAAVVLDTLLAPHLSPFRSAGTKADP
jgi:hypothetical protein